ncbi:MAG: manganese efflux pump MntP family protein [Lachnospiraceae bacterium]|nr:manganese efflux pump MntP family protein [Lachnospiraceae bacterium]
MEWNLVFFVNSILLGVGLAMDAFSVSMANGLHETRMGRGRMLVIAGVYAFFQFLMPMAGWVCVHTIVETFKAFDQFVPWIALILLCYIGGKMIYEAVCPDGEKEEYVHLSMGTLLVQGIATSIDALSVGFTIADYGAAAALVCSLLIGAVTLVICLAGLELGKKAGTKLSGKADILGGTILILIGLEIFIKRMIL